MTIDTRPAVPAGPTSPATPASLISTRTLIEPALTDALERLDPATRRVAGYHLGLWDTEGHRQNGSGKGLRSGLAVLSARAVAGTAGTADSDQTGIAGAVAVELVHNFSLLHDDVMDGDAERRHRPTAWAAFGMPDAILAGDALLALAAEVLAERAPSDLLPEGIRSLTTTTRRLIAGQSADTAFERRHDVTLEDCLAMARDKTGALLSCAASIGALLSDAPPELTAGLAAYGERLGLAFQLVDDLLGLWGDPVLTGKPILSDLRAGKKTVPIVVALRAGTAASRELRPMYTADAIGRGALSENDLARAAELVERAGGRAWTETEAARQHRSALAALDGIGLPADVHAELTEIADFTTGRTH